MAHNALGFDDFRDYVLPADFATYFDVDVIITMFQNSDFVAINALYELLITFFRPKW